MVDFSSEVNALKEQISKKNQKINYLTSSIKAIKNNMDALTKEMEELKRTLDRDENDKLEIIESINKALGKPSA